MSLIAYDYKLSPVKNLSNIWAALGLTIKQMHSEPGWSARFIHQLYAKARFGVLVERSGQTAASIATAGAGTYTAANIKTGLILRDCAGASRTDTTDTAANLISGLALAYDYEEVCVDVQNNSAGAYTITLAGGTNVTLQTAISIAQASATRLAVRRTSPTTVAVREV